MAKSSTSWQKGQTGNPRGRPAIADRYRRLLAEVDKRGGVPVEEVIAQVFVQQARSGSLKAWEHILERVEGKVADKVDATVNQRTEVAVAPDTLAAVLAGYAVRRGPGVGST